MTSDRRVRRVVNLGIQKALALRIVFHAVLFVWSVLIVCVGMLIFAGEVQNDESLDRIRSICFRAIGFSAVILLPAIIYDSVKFSHRMAGPILRLKNVLPRIGVERVNHINLRKHDFWGELIAEVNIMLDRVEALRLSAEPKAAGDDQASLELADAPSAAHAEADAVLCEPTGAH